MQANNAPPDFEIEDGSESDELEDAEAKLERLRAAADSARLQTKPASPALTKPGSTHLEGHIATTKRPANAKRRKRQAAEAPVLLSEQRGDRSGRLLEIDGLVPEANGMAFESEQLNSENARKPSVLQRVAEQQRSVNARAHLLSEGAPGPPRDIDSPKGRRGPQANGHRPVTIGPAAFSPADDLSEEKRRKVGDVEAAVEVPLAPNPTVTIAEPAVIENRNSGDEEETMQGDTCGSLLLSQHTPLFGFPSFLKPAEYE